MPTTLFPDAVITGELLEHLRGLPDRYELVEGRIVPLSPTSADHAEAVAHIARILGNAIDRTHWVVQAGEGGIYTKRRPDSIRGADVAVISRARKAQRDPTRAFLTVAPELVIEVLSPSNEETDVNEKVQEYLRAGVIEVWLVDLAARVVTVARGDVAVETLPYQANESTELRLPDGAPVVLADLFPS
jgi:Uma2 family endonuclease